MARLTLTPLHKLISAETRDGGEAILFHSSKNARDYSRSRQPIETVDCQHLTPLPGNRCLAETYNDHTHHRQKIILTESLADIQAIFQAADLDCPPQPWSQRLLSFLHIH